MSLLIKIENRNKKYNPTTTNVEECTKADTGIGATIATGNHKLKGYWDLFSINENKNKKKFISIKFNIKFKFNLLIKIIKEINIKISLNRFIIATNIL